MLISADDDDLGPHGLKVDQIVKERNRQENRA
jgi:hypothetical protein